MTSAAAGATLVDEQKRRQSCEMHRARLKATSDCRLLVHSFGSVSLVTGLPVDSFGSLAFVTVELRASRASTALLSRKALVFKEGWAAYQPVFKGRLDRFSAAGLQGWTAFQQLAFRPLCKQFRAAFFVNRGVAELSASQMLCGREGAPVTVWAGQALPQPCRRRTSRSARRALPINRTSGRGEAELSASPMSRAEEHQ